MLKVDANFEEKLTCGIINDMRNLVNFTGAFKNLKICIFRGLFVQGM